MFKRFLMQMVALLAMVHANEVGAIKVKAVEASTIKWTENASRASEVFATEAEASADLWARQTVAARDNYGMAITAPGIKERFAKGVAKAGAAKFARKIRDVARDRFGPGVAAATSDYKAGVEPYFATLSAMTLSARKPRGDPANYKRVEEVGKALNAKRLALLGVSGSSSAGG